MSYRAPARENCHACGKTVYAMEMMKADNLVFHKQCMKCTECQKVLSLGNYAALQGKYYCKPHFKQLFALKGNYSEGFGEEQHKMKWIKKEGEDSDSEQAAPPAQVNETPADVVKSGSNVNAAADAAAAVAAATAGNLKNKFEQLKTENDNQLLAPTRSLGSGEPSPISSPFASRREKCVACNKVVYAMDKMVADEKIFHKTCMKCEHCGKTLSLGNYAALGGKYYCKPHFKQLFATKGNYSEGFGEENHKMKWVDDEKKRTAAEYAQRSIGAIDEDGNAVVADDNSNHHNITTTTSGGNDDSNHNENHNHNHDHHEKESHNENENENENENAHEDAHAEENANADENENAEE